MKLLNTCYDEGTQKVANCQVPYRLFLKRAGTGSSSRTSSRELKQIRILSYMAVPKSSNQFPSSQDMSWERELSGGF
jgi:hypothetical protein